ncbi:MAG: LuxR C-terminal-related transcriptional regulator, partial [Proteobacteria bacterium]|nr:LuxR C-terminal-related transcriptional regulator [Pseudomonadota bacterium]
PDLIFLDMCMPVLDGIGFLKEWKQRGISPCPVIAITGYEDDLVLGECFDQGIFSLIRKPCHPFEIVALCRRYTRLTEIKKRLSFNVDTVAFLSKQASTFGLDNIDEQDLIEALPLPVFVKNKERVLIQVNRAFEEFTGLSRDAIIGKSCEDISSDKQFVAQDHESELSLVENRGVSCLEQMVTERSGKQREVIVCRSAVISGSSNDWVGILGVLIDITEFGFSSFKKQLAIRYPTLSAREREVANLVRLGMSNKEVAHQLNIALCTVEYHRAHLREKLGLKKGDNVNLSTALLSL